MKSCVVAERGVAGRVILAEYDYRRWELWVDGSRRGWPTIVSGLNGKKSTRHGSIPQRLS